MSVSFPGGDSEIARQYGSWQGNHHVVALLEVVCPANDTAAGNVGGFLAGAGRIIKFLTHVYPAVVDGFTVGGRFGNHRGHPAAHQRTRHSRSVDCLLFQTDLYQVFCELGRVGVRGNFRPPPQPFNRNKSHF